MGLWNQKSQDSQIKLKGANDLYVGTERVTPVRSLPLSGREGGVIVPRLFLLTDWKFSYKALVLKFYPKGKEALEKFND